MKIIIENSDSQIWHKNKVLADIIHAATISSENILIDLNSEGPCAESLGLYDLLDSVCQQFLIDPQRFTVRTCNFLEHHGVYQIVKSAPMKGVKQLQDQLQHTPPKFKLIDSNTKLFGNFVGHGNRIRLAIASHLYHYHRDKTLQSYHTNVKNPYFNEFIGLEELMFQDYSADQVDIAFEFLKVTPLKLDNIVSYPILHEKNVYDILDYYPNIFVDIVNQTYFSGNTFYLDDKFWRSVITKTPFIVQGPANFLINLRRLGFQTFDRWWDEGFSEDPSDVQAVEIIKIIDEIAQWDLSRIVNTYDQMKPVLDHNYKRFMELNNKEFKRIFLHD